MWLAGNDIRDFFISTTPAQAAQLRTQIEALRSEDEAALQHMERLPRMGATAATLRKSLGEFWATIAPLPETMRTYPTRDNYVSAGCDCPAARTTLHGPVGPHHRGSGETPHSEKDFAETRRKAAERLLMMLVLSVFLGIVVARLSVRHAETWNRKRTGTSLG